MSYESDKLFFNITSLVRRALDQGAIPFELHFSPDLLRKFDKQFADRWQPPRGDKDKRPWLKLNGIQSIPFVADRSLRPNTCVLVTNKNLEGIAVDLSALHIPDGVKPAEISAGAAKPVPAIASPSTWKGRLKSRLRKFFGS